MQKPQQPVRNPHESREPQMSAGPRRWKALAVIAVAHFILILDLTVVNVALPGLLIFTLASLACGLAQNETLLISGRVGQGAGAAMLSPAALAAITNIFHGEEHNKALSVWASLGGIGFTAGVLIGGVLTSGPGWRWVFFINVPVGLVLLAAIRAVVPPRRHPDRAARVDVLGAVTVTAATGSFIYGLINAGDQGWADLGTLLPIAAAIVLYGVFTVIERTVRTPLMHLNLLSRRPIAAGAFLMFIGAGVLIADLFLGSQYLQHVRDLSAWRPACSSCPRPWPS